MFKNLILLAAATSAVVFAQTEPALNAQLVKTGLYVISGAGCNSVLRLSTNGFILVDAGLPGNYDALMKKVAKITYSDQPIRALILTDHGAHHAGNNAQFLEDGTRIIAHENAAQNLAAQHPGQTPPPPIVGSEVARLRASHRPPLKLYVQFSRIQLSRRLMLPGGNRRD
ncbi:MAG: hypothetical protein ABSC05_34815, partial [Candidatus Solibacter sp.]